MKNSNANFLISFLLFIPLFGLSQSFKISNKEVENDVHFIDFGTYEMNDEIHHFRIENRKNQEKVEVLIYDLDGALKKKKAFSIKFPFNTKNQYDNNAVSGHSRELIKCHLIDEKYELTISTIGFIELLKPKMILEKIIVSEDGVLEHSTIIDSAYYPIGNEHYQLVHQNDESLDVYEVNGKAEVKGLKIIYKKKIMAFDKLTNEKNGNMVIRFLIMKIMKTNQKSIMDLRVFI